MKKLRFLPLLLAGLLPACSKDDAAADTTYPEIDISAADAFPVQCSVLKRGENFDVKMLLRDNRELGSLSIDIHHNFDQHSHSTEVNTCNSDPVKIPVNPFVLIKSYPLPAAQTSYRAEMQISVPQDIDPGDYHFLVRVTDKAGWQTIRGISIKII
ncbi:DUF4625 domain-containing protein [Chitinophaga sedimenti]|uniref:DUF4625 domain-containing protein n=1 Tax=Chitinophaga sedimenti TaxID=2033606 RepID=UPI0020041337|nr:DUF4625 domain-containing protein [Chitinophaga sedimenti]MCK7556483.1 DUF4625 domain-containing protein [Chitinophaga sedimenti]